MKPSEQAEIVAKVLAGDIDLYAHIIRFCHRDVWRVVNAMLFAKDQTEELVQEVFVIIFKRLGQFKPGGDLIVWSKEIARNVVRKELRRKSREERRLDSCRELLLAQMEGNPDWNEEGQRRMEALGHCRGSLVPKWENIFRLRYAESYSLQEIAQEIGSTAEAVRKILARGRVMLRDCIEQRLASL